MLGRRVGVQKAEAVARATDKLTVEMTVEQHADPLIDWRCEFIICISVCFQQERVGTWAKVREIRSDLILSYLILQIMYNIKIQVEFALEINNIWCYFYEILQISVNAIFYFISRTRSWKKSAKKITFSKTSLYSFSEGECFQMIRHVITFLKNSRYVALNSMLKVFSDRCSNVAHISSNC